MKPPKDLFSDHAGLYNKFRPSYPHSVYEEILSQTRGRHRCWDCATGNGQVARDLARYFEQVEATDISAPQLQLAARDPKIRYSLQRAEETDFPDSHFDLITVAQAIHWFNLPEFFREVQRVGKPGATLAFWGYGLLETGENTDSLIQDFYMHTVGPYWTEERDYIDQKYRTIKPGFGQPRLLQTSYLITRMSLQKLLGYLSSWSSVQRFIHTTGHDPLPGLRNDLERHWGIKEVKTVRFPLFGQVLQL